MAFGIVHHFPGGTKENYEASLAAVHPGVDKLPDGQIFHRRRFTGWLDHRGGPRIERELGAVP